MAVTIMTGSGSEPIQFSNGESFNVNGEGVLYIYNAGRDAIAVYAPGKWSSAVIDGEANGGGSAAIVQIY